MSYIAFISSLPTETNNHDGYYRRVQNVESVFSDQERTHLDIRFWKNWRKRSYMNPEGMKIYHLNAFLHIRTISTILLLSRFVYIHSIAKVPGILLPITLYASRLTLVLDLHGVIVDELKLARKSIVALFYTPIEWLCFKRCQVMIYVTEAMMRHFHDKYPFYKGKELIFYTNTGNGSFEEQFDKQEVEKLRTKFGIQDSDVVIFYSGNCQEWQNIDLMLDCFKKLESSSYKMLILSGQEEKFRDKIRKRNIPDDRIAIISVRPEHLASYYQLAHYGMILREDILVNRVANPTKLTEYLQFGVIPVVKLAAIGDYLDYRYEYLNYQDISDNLIPRKSNRNREIYKEVSEKYGSGPLRELLLHLDRE